jgi:outer membrane protein
LKTANRAAIPKPFAARAGEDEIRGTTMNIVSKTFAALGALAAIGGAGMAMPAQAADISTKDTYAAEEEYLAPASIWGPGWMIRARGIGVIPDEDSSDWTVNGASTSGPDLSIDDAVVPELDISYFFTKNIAMELVLAVTPHTIDSQGSIADEGEIGDVWLLPPTLTLQYHFDMGKFKPYVGAGVNYTVFFDEDAGSNFSGLDLDDNFGWALQAGFDYHLQGNWFFNVDVKKLWLDTDASVTLNPSTDVTADVDIDPWIVGVGIGYKFGAPREPLASLK